MVRDGGPGAFGPLHPARAAPIPVRRRRTGRDLQRRDAAGPRARGDAADRGTASDHVDADIEDPTDPRFVAVDRVEELLTSPVGGLDATDVRSLARALRARENFRAQETGEPALSSRDLLRRSVLDAELLDGVGGGHGAAARRLADLLARARGVLDDGGTAEEALWVLWNGTEWGRRLRAATRPGGNASRFAHRDLDALCALFEAASKAEEQRGHTSVQSFLDTLTAQEIPADTLADRGVRGGAVRLLTAHRSKGLEWRLVVVAHVQDGAWPDLRRRGSLLSPDRIGHVDGLLPQVTTAALLAEERRLFYVACTRARERLVVTAVRSPDDEGEQPSRFLHELGWTPLHKVGRPSRPLSLHGLVAELRRTVADPDKPDLLRRAAASRLARLAQTEVNGRPVAPQADPATWWGMRRVSRSERPLRQPDSPVAVSASMLQALLDCPAKWFLEREAGGERVTTSSQGFGTVVHAIADRVGPRRAQSRRRPDGAGRRGLGPDGLPHRVVPRSRTRGGRGRAAPVRRVGRRRTAHPARHRGADRRGDHAARRPGGPAAGYADRLELDADGKVWVVDLKTGKYHPTDKSVADNSQLGLYQLAVQSGAVDDEVGRPAESGGAELVHLRIGGELPKVQAQPPQPKVDGATTVQRQLMQVTRAVRDEELVARPEQNLCKRCAFVPICPAHAAGSVLS